MKKDDKKPVYILCPRCELNYINKKDKYCTVCKAELGMLDKGFLIPDDDDEGEERLCPVCRVNYLEEDEDICFMCKKEREEKASHEEAEEGFENDETIVEEDAADDDLDMIPLSELEEEENEDENDEYEGDKEPDDFDYDVDPSDFEEDDEEEDEDEDDEDF